MNTRLELMVEEFSLELLYLRSWMTEKGRRIQKDAHALIRLLNTMQTAMQTKDLFGGHVGIVGI